MTGGIDAQIKFDYGHSSMINFPRDVYFIALCADEYFFLFLTDFILQKSRKNKQISYLYITSYLRRGSGFFRFDH